MRCWLPEHFYRMFPLLSIFAGFMGCLAGTGSCLALGGVLILYGGGVICMRR